MANEETRKGKGESEAQQLLRALGDNALANRAALSQLARQRDEEIRREAQAAAQPMAAEPDEDFEHGDIIAASRSPRGFRRSGVFVPAEKTVIPAGTFKSRAAYEAFMSDPNIIAVEGSKDKKLSQGAGVASVGTGGAFTRSTAILGGATENATPEMLAAAEQGELRSHPVMGAGITFPAATGPVMSEGAAEIEKVRMERSERESKKRSEGERPTIAERADEIRSQLEEQGKASPHNPAANAKRSKGDDSEPIGVPSTSATPATGGTK